METFTTSDGLSLAYVDQGQGPAVLCLAGLTRTHRDFDEMTAAITGARVIAMDYRGRGQSDYDPNPMNYTAMTEARDALELLDHLGLEKAAIIGTSRGGMVAMVMAGIAKNRLSGVLLNDVGPELDHGDLGRIVKYIGCVPSYKTYAEAARKYPDECIGFSNISTERWRTEVEKCWRDTGDGLVIRYDRGLRKSVDAMFNAPDIDLWPFFGAFSDLPLALLRGANSQLLSVETADKMRALRPDMLFAEVPDRGHAPLLDEPASLALINTFLSQIA